MEDDISSGLESRNTTVMFDVEGYPGDEGLEVRSSETDELTIRTLQVLFDELRSLARCNINYYNGATGVSNQRIYTSFSHLLEHLERGVESGTAYLLRAASFFDFDRSHPANGYRSFVKIVQKCCMRIADLGSYILVNRESYLFRAGHYSLELEAYVTCLGQLRACLFYLQKLILYCPDGELVANEELLPPEEYAIAERLLKEVESLSQEVFYGRCFGFQIPLTTINLAMASYGDGYSHSSWLRRLVTSVLSSTKYINPELRAKKVVTMTRSGDIQFCKSFWHLGESVFVTKVPLYFCPAVDVDKIIMLGSETINMPLVGRSGLLEVLPLPDPINVRLISLRLRTGQEVLWTRSGLKPPSYNVLPASNCLIIHCHGGGFVAQSSASHLIYLRQWASELDCPIFSVDYSLAPEHRFPCQLNEVFFAYCWALLNSHLLGTSAEKVCIVGDSAGANLAVAVSLKALSCGIRQPDGILSIYGCLLIKYAPSPSRILALLDPLLPIGLLSLCLHAYADETTEAAEMKANSESSRYIDKTVSVASLVQLESRTGAGVDRGTRGVVNRFASSPYWNVDNHANSPPKMADMQSCHETTSDDHVQQKCFKSLLTKTLSTPVFASSVISKTSGKTLEDELLHLSTYAKIRHFAISQLDNFKNGRISQSPFVSPLLAEDELLRSLCPVHLVACNLDPMLDDTVMFARRLRRLGNEVSVEFVDDVPHGFLNFVLMSPEAKQGSALCVRSLKQLLGQSL